MSKAAEVPYTSSNLFIISATRACRPRYQMRSSMAPCKYHTIPSFNITSVWLCITLLTSKAHCSNRTCPFWVEFPLNVLDFGILPTTCEATLEQKILCCVSNIGLGNCMLAPSTDTLSSLSAQYNHSPAIICSGVATLHPVFTLWPNHISMDHNFLHTFWWSFCHVCFVVNVHTA